MKFFDKRKLPPSVPIVPMIDILTILLIFFIVHSQWKKPKSLLEIDIPGVKHIASLQETKVRATITLGKNQELLFNGQAVSQATLGKTLQDYKKQHPDMQLEVEADKNVPLQQVLDMWDTLTEVGIDIKSAPIKIEIEPSAAPAS